MRDCDDWEAVRNTLATLHTPPHSIEEYIRTTTTHSGVRSTNKSQQIAPSRITGSASHTGISGLWGAHVGSESALGRLMWWLGVPNGASKSLGVVMLPVVPAACARRAQKRLHNL